MAMAACIRSTERFEHPPLKVVAVEEAVKISRLPVRQVKSPPVDGFKECLNPLVKRAECSVMPCAQHIGNQARNTDGR